MGRQPELTPSVTTNKMSFYDCGKYPKPLPELVEGNTGMRCGRSPDRTTPKSATNDRK